MNSVLKEVAKGAAAIFTKKVTTVDSDGDEITKIRPREGVKGIGWIAGFLIAWHFFVQPLLAYYFPNISFPTLDFGWVSGLLMSI